jgi:catechol 2,3-dioxygenase-like lactoylglutathione lyase family enzyme
MTSSSSAATGRASTTSRTRPSMPKPCSVPATSRARLATERRWSGPGRHGPGHAQFVYMRDPDGHRVELFTTHF